MCETGEGQTEHTLFQSDFMTLIILGEKITGVRHLHYKTALSFMFSLQLAHFLWILETFSANVITLMLYCGGFIILI